ncbi:MAG: SDR family oxidoreductase [Thermoclostridium sp.]|nr:SDR family oxidoreductase [Thermoclostridium sp.]
MEQNRCALVTGASRGIGRETARALVRVGYKVIGTCRNPVKVKPEDEIDGVEYLPLELIDEKSIDALLDRLERVDVLVNNAGASQMGPVEEVSMEKVRQLYQLSFFGHLRLIQGIIPKMRQQNQGIIINVTSLASHLPVPFSSVYASAKSAMEVMGNGLRNELAPFGIRVVTVAPSFIKTDIYQEKILGAGSVYAGALNTAKAIRDSKIQNGSDPAVVAAKIMQIIGCKNPKPFYAAGQSAVLMALISKLIPAELVEKSIRKQFKIESSSQKKTGA